MLQGTIIRGTTPTHEFDLPYPQELIENIRIVYGQNKKAVVTKTEYDCVVKEGKISVDLIQEETFLFSPRRTVEIEIRIKFKDGKVVRTEEPIILKVVDSMSDEVID